MVKNLPGPPELVHHHVEIVLEFLRKALVQSQQQGILSLNCPQNVPGECYPALFLPWVLSLVRCSFGQIGDHLLRGLEFQFKYRSGFYESQEFYRENAPKGACPPYKLENIFQ
jgi:hypothetical protein